MNFSDTTITAVRPVAWMPKTASKHCLLCQQSFSIFSWRHHCRHCGVLCCDNCSDHKMFNVPGYPTSIPVRKQQSSSGSSNNLDHLNAQQSSFAQGTNENNTIAPSPSVASSSVPQSTVNQRSSISNGGTNPSSSAGGPPLKPLEAVPERVCNSCFLCDYAHVLVYNLMITGWQTKILAGTREELLEHYSVIPSYASRVLIRVGSGEILASYFARQTWEVRVMDKAHRLIREKMGRYVIRSWIGETQVPPGAYVPTSMAAILTAAAAGGVGAVSGATAQPLHVAPPPPPSANFATAPPPSEDRTIAVQFGVMVLFRQDGADSTDHLFLNFPYAARDEVVAEGGRFLSAVPRLQYGGVLELTHGEQQQSHPVLRLHHLKQSPTHQASPPAWLKTFQQYFEQLSTVLVIQESSSQQPTVEFGKFQQHYTTCRRKEQQWQQQEEQGGLSRALVLLDIMGNMVLFCAPSHEAKERLGVIAGDAIMARQSLSVIIAVHPAVSVTASATRRRIIPDETNNHNGRLMVMSVFSNNQPDGGVSPRPSTSSTPVDVTLQGSAITATALYDMYSARTFLWATAGSALFAVATQTTTAVLLQHHIYLTKAEALAQRGPTAAQTARSLVGDSAVAETRTAADAVVATAANVSAPQSIDERRPLPTPSPPPPPPAVAAPPSRRNTPECGICFLPFNGEQNRPCLCALCGNSMCLQCIGSVDACPFCRRDMPRTADGGYITNVMLLQMIDGDD